MTETRSTVERLRKQLPPKDEWPLDRWSEWAVPVSADVLAGLIEVVEAAQDWAKARAAFMETGGSAHPDYKTRGIVLALAEQNLLAALHSQASDEGKP